MEHLPNEIPPAERRLPEGVKTALLVVLALVAAVVVGTRLQNPSPDRVLAGALMLISCLWLLGLGARRG